MWEFFLRSSGNMMRLFSQKLFLSKLTGRYSSKLYKSYIEEHLSVLKAAHPHYTGLFDTFPLVTFRLHNWIGTISRYARRLFKGELNKVRDTNV